MDRLEAQLTFARELDRLKGVLRQSRLFDDSRAENSAEHSWHIAILATLLAEYGPPGIDLARVVRLCLVHDIVEIDAGDVFIYAEADRAAVAVAEVAAAQRLFGLLPPEQANRIRAACDRDS
ncbi:MAG: HD domain-containing protein, partial [Opitutales bacterium]